MKRYYRLNEYEREEISRMLLAGLSLRKIAEILKRTPGTICREIKRHSPAGKDFYRACIAHKRASFLAQKTRKKIKLEMNADLRVLVFSLLMKFWSPEQIAQSLKKRYPNDPNMNISHEAIYTYLYVLPKGTLKKKLVFCLRQRHNQRKPLDRKIQSNGPIQFFTSIEDRPKEVEDRTIPGHWEGDLMIGSRRGSALGTLVERTTRFTLLVPLKAQDAFSVREAFAVEMKHLPEELRRSLTYDQGTEMSQHRLFSEQTKIKVYFAHPRSPWERGTNENTNGLLRQFFPKGTDFRRYSREQIKKAQDLFNGRPRKVLDWNTPQETFSKLLH